MLYFGAFFWRLERPETLVMFWLEVRFIPWREKKVHTNVVRKYVPHAWIFAKPTFLFDQRMVRFLKQIINWIVMINFLFIFWPVERVVYNTWVRLPASFVIGGTIIRLVTVEFVGKPTYPRTICMSILWEKTVRV